ncbi:hypothetical protein FRX31_025162 [Thalictrum thalictroides]|uniref:Uncharacterized protein n=1 Tax=Thalictrum thalictroides TaxID=46969 RepID=A0A7J6VKG7_THATH|nr:hypothetical protein FRX31_025162 [Thalictrum thalictroides]
MEPQGVAVSNPLPPPLQQPDLNILVDFLNLKNQPQQPITNNSTWSSLFSRSNSSVDCSLSFKEPNVVDGVIFIPDEVIEVGKQ